MRRHLEVVLVGKGRTVERWEEEKQVNVKTPVGGISSGWHRKQLGRKAGGKKVGLLEATWRYWSWLAEEAG